MLLFLSTNSFHSFTAVFYVSHGSRPTFQVSVFYEVFSRPQIKPLPPPFLEGAASGRTVYRRHRPHNACGHAYPPALSPSASTLRPRLFCLLSVSVPSPPSPFPNVPLLSFAPPPYHSALVFRSSLAPPASSFPLSPRRVALPGYIIFLLSDLDPGRLVAPST
jgi:hypothetical protein